VGEAILGIIGGSGLYDIEGLEERREVAVETPFGAPSDPYLTGVLDGVRVAFLARHGAGHRLLPSEINYRANIHGFRQLGARHLLGFSAVGSLRDDIHPGDLVLPDQYFDRTKGRPATFFGDGLVAHAAFGDPVCPCLGEALAQTLGELGATHHRGGTYVCIEGPMFSTRAESVFYRALGASVIGMTNLPEAKLAREAEMCYASLALATDYDCWHASEAAVSVDAVLKVFRQNIATARRAIRGLVRRFPPAGTCACQSALEGAVMTAPERIPAEARERLALLLARFFQR
jgi:5'-methylthioadenosine phosphorylase